MKEMWMSVLVFFVCALASMSVGPRESTAGTMEDKMMKQEGTMKDKETREDKMMKQEGTMK